MSGLPKADTTGRFMSTRPSLTPLADLGRSAGQAPLHRPHAAGIAAAGDDPEVGRDRLHKWKMARVADIVLIDLALMREADAD